MLTPAVKVYGTNKVSRSGHHMQRKTSSHKNKIEISFLAPTALSLYYSSCGESPVDFRSRIVGGNESQQGWWPWHIGLYHRIGGDNISAGALNQEPAIPILGLCNGISTHEAIFRRVLK